MKRLIYKIQLLVTGLFVCNLAMAQLPLQFGDGVITHSPNSYAATGPTTTPAVLRVVHTSNTVSAPLGATWDLPSKPANDFYPNWNVNNLGYVFGITLDQQPSPNIYVSSTQIYTNTTLNKRQVWRLNGINGSHSLVYDFNNISGSGNLTSSRSLGNLKYLKAGLRENIYVSDWETGSIQRLTGNSGGTAIWAIQNAFVPLFGKPAKDINEMPYGLAVRRMASGAYKLYYAKVSTNSNSNSIGGYGGNEVWSVDLDPNGGFISGTETMSITPNINRNPSSWGGYTPGGGYNGTILPVISDIAFTRNGQKMLIGQQPWGAFAQLAPHNADVREFLNAPLSSNTWINSGNQFPAGNYIGVGNYCNSVGGVSYSDNILKKNGVSFACDTTVWFMADYINVQNATSSTLGNTVYGLQGMNANGGVANTRNNSIWIDADDLLNYYDKIFLGDVEIYKNPTACAEECACGTWNSIGLNADPKWWVNDATAGHQGSPIPTLTFNQGQSTGVILPNYSCSGSCSPAFTYQIINIDGTSAGTWSGPSLDLGQDKIRNLRCGSYSILITPTCGETTCPGVRINLVIVCPPPCPGCNSESSAKLNGTPVITAVSNQSNPNPVSTLSASLTITNSVPVTEIRVLVDEFRIYSTSGNDNCILCKNQPKTWGSFQAGMLTGVALQTALNTALTNDTRELVFTNGPGTLFNLSSGKTLSFTLGLPGVTGLDCCNLKAEICMKLIIRDVNCCEKEVVKCITINLQ